MKRLMPSGSGVSGVCGVRYPFCYLSDDADPRENLTWAAFGWNRELKTFMAGDQDDYTYDAPPVNVRAAMLVNYMQAFGGSHVDPADAADPALQPPGSWPPVSPS
jgi:hypothetical protein